MGTQAAPATREIAAVGVIGAGQMGSGIAQLAAAAGCGVFLLDSDPAALSRAAASISSSLGRLVAKGQLSQAACDDSVKRIKCVSDVQELRGVDLVIEAIVESEDVKKKLFMELDKITKPSAILASNTSSISITRLASATSRPSQVDKFASVVYANITTSEHASEEKSTFNVLQFLNAKYSSSVIGMHFFNPPPIMKLVEIIRGADTSEEVFSQVKSFSERIGKVVICSQDYPGFIVNRILMPMINEAFWALYTGVATKEDIDTGMKLGTNHPMGPLQLADFIGLDVCLSVLRVLHNGLGDNKYSPCPLLVQYVDAGRLGKKRGQGVYSYGRSSSSIKPKSSL